MDNREWMDAGLIYDPTDTALSEQQTDALELLYDFNATRPSQSAERSELLQRMFASAGAGCYIEPPLHANWGGRHVHLGAHVYANFNLTLVDDGPIHIGDNVWIGSGVQIMPGVTSGANTVIGAGSTVTRDLPADVVAVGTPCRIVRQIGEHDRTYFWRDREFDLPVDELIARFA